MNFFKKLFNKDQAEPRVLNQPHDLMVKDIIIFTDSFALPEQIRGQQFQISAINSYEFEHKVITEWMLSGTTDTELYLSLDIDDKSYLKLSLKINEADVEQLFNLEQFSQIFESPGNAILELQTESSTVLNSTTQGWVCPQYQQSKFAEVGYFHRQDHRSNEPSKFEGKDSGEQFELYSLMGSDDAYSIDVEVWQDGDTDVFVNYYRPLSDISDFFPGS